MRLDRRASLRLLGLGALAAAALRPVQMAYAQDPRASVVIGVARDWVQLVDAGDVAASHARAGAKFRAALSVPEWTAAVQRERAPRGAVVQRAVQRTRFNPKLDKAPPGEYAIVRFRTTFERQNTAEEVLTLEHESDGTWRVIGYFVN